MGRFGYLLIFNEHIKRLNASNPDRTEPAKFVPASRKGTSF